MPPPEEPRAHLVADEEEQPSRDHEAGGEPATRDDAGRDEHAEPARHFQGERPCPFGRILEETEDGKARHEEGDPEHRAGQPRRGPAHSFTGVNSGV